MIIMIIMIIMSLLALGGQSCTNTLVSKSTVEGQKMTGRYQNDN